MPVAPLTSGGNGVPFLVSAGLVYEIIAANCSSPQTTEINAGSRAGTLMKWVHLGLGQAVLFVGLAVLIDREHTVPIIAGGTIAAAIQYGAFVHAKANGLKNGGPGTEH